MQRYDEELEKLLATQVGKTRMARHHRLQHASREDNLRQLIARDIQLYQTSGFGKDSKYMSVYMFPLCCSPWGIRGGIIVQIAIARNELERSSYFTTA